MYWSSSKCCALQPCILCMRLHSTPRQLRMRHASALPTGPPEGHPGAHQQVPPARARRCARQQLPVAKQLPIAAQRLGPHDVGALRRRQLGRPLRALSLQRHIRHGLQGPLPGVHPHLRITASNAQHHVMWSSKRCRGQPWAPTAHGVPCPVAGFLGPSQA